MVCSLIKVAVKANCGVLIQHLWIDLPSCKDACKENLNPKPSLGSHPKGICYGSDPVVISLGVIHFCVRFKDESWNRQKIELKCHDTCLPCLCDIITITYPLKVVLHRSPRSPDIHDLIECYHLYYLGRHTEQPTSLTVLTLTPKNYPWDLWRTTLNIHKRILLTVYGHRWAVGWVLKNLSPCFNNATRSVKIAMSPQNADQATPVAQLESSISALLWMPI